MPRLIRVLVITGLWCAELRAEDTGSVPDDRDAEVMVVTAPPWATLSHVVTADDLDIAGLETVAEALDWVAGATARIAGQGAARFDMRGSRQRSSCVLLDGVPVTEPWGGSFDLERIPLTAVHSIEVVPGPPGDPTVPGCPGGMIHVLTRDPTDARGSEARIDGGTGWRAALRGTAAAPLGQDDRWGMLGSAQLSRRSYTVLPGSFEPMNAEDGGARELSDSRNLALLGTVAHDAHSGRLRIGYHGVIDGHGSPPDLSMAPRFQRVEPLHRQQLGLRWSWVPRPDLSVTSTAHGAWMRMDSVRYDDASARTEIWRERIQAGGGGGSLQARASVMPWLSLTALTAVGSEGARTTEADELNELEQTAASTDWTAGGGLHLEPAASVQLDAWARAYGWRGGPTAPVGRATLHWQPREALGLRASAARGARAPTLRERFDPSRGSEDLRPEQAEQLELALVGSHGGWIEWDLAGWRKHAEDVINAPSDGQPFTNNEPADYAGVEGALRLRPTPWLRLRAAHAWTAVLAGSLDHVPAHQLVAAARVQLPWRLWLDSDLSWVTERSSGAVMLDPYRLWDLQLGLSLPRGLWARLRVDNLLDAATEDRALTPGPGRTLLLSVGGRWWQEAS